MEENNKLKTAHNQPAEKVFTAQISDVKKRKRSTICHIHDKIMYYGTL